MSFLFTDSLDRVQEMDAQAKKEKRENGVLRRVIDSGLDIANQLMMTSEFSTRMAYRDRENDDLMRRDKDLDRDFDMADRLAAQRASAGPASRSAGRRPDLDYRTANLERKVASPSSPGIDMEFE